jgi:hypothetical protein
MRSDWVPMSASALVIGAMSLVFGSVLNPADPGSSTAQTLSVVSQEGARWLGMAVMYAFASVTLNLGLPAVLTLFTGRRGRGVALVGVAVFSVGVIGTSGYAMLMVFFRATVVAGALRGDQLADVSHEHGLVFFLIGWIASFYGGVLLIAVALLMSGTTSRWVPLLLLVFVAMLPFAAHLGRVASAVQVMAFAAAFTGIAVAAVSRADRGPLSGRPVV